MVLPYELFQKKEIIAPHFDFAREFYFAVEMMKLSDEREKSAIIEKDNCTFEAKSEATLSYSNICDTDPKSQLPCRDGKYLEDAYQQKYQECLIRKNVQ